MKCLRLWGPTNFAPTIRQMREYCQSLVEEQRQTGRLKYTILLLLTDGEVTDEAETIDELVKASNLPLSVIIVGIGPSEFGTMERLDADKEPLVSSKDGQS